MYSFKCTLTVLSVITSLYFTCITIDVLWVMHVGIIKVTKVICLG